MSENIPTQQASEEIDLGYLFKKIGDFFKKCLLVLFKIITFFLKYKFIILVLIVVGVVLGFYKDVTSEPILNNEAIVIPNFGGVDYLYDKVNALNAKIEAEDTLYLKTIMGGNYEKLKEIEVEHIDDLFNNVSSSGDRVELFDILSQSKEADEFLNYYSITKTYKHHRLTFQIEGKDDSIEIVESIMEFLNNNSHYQEYLEIYKEHNKFLIDFNIEILKQIDSLLAQQTREVRSSNSQVFEIDEKNYIPQLIDRKQEISRNLLALKKNEVDYSKSIKVIKVDYNLLNTEKFKISPKILYPILLVITFCLIFLLKYIYYKMKLIAFENKTA